jgi:hypothetical protein
MPYYGLVSAYLALSCHASTAGGNPQRQALQNTGLVQTAQASLFLRKFVFEFTGQLVYVCRFTK